MDLESVIIILYQSVIDTDSLDFIKNCDPDDYSERTLRDIAWECGKYDLDCTGEQWYTAMDHIKYIANNGWNKYVSDYKR